MNLSQLLKFVAHAALHHKIASSVNMPFQHGESDSKDENIEAEDRDEDAECTNARQIVCIHSRRWK